MGRDRIEPNAPKVTDLESQDKQLDILAARVNSLKFMALSIGNEIQDSTNALEEISLCVDHSDRRKAKKGKRVLTESYSSVSLNQADDAKKQVRS